MFCSVFYAFEIRRKSKEDYMEVRERRWELGYGIVTKFDYVLSSGWLSERCVHLDAQKQWVGPA